ncbi:MAG: hypothetical protein ACLGH6_08550 [Gammaproteobacteria bacterium]
MNTLTTARIRRSFLTLATAVAIAVPGLGSAAGFADRIQTIKTKAGVHITNVQQNRPRPLAKAVENVAAPANGVFQKVKDLQVVEQFNQTMELVQRMQADYQYFSGGQGCSGTCAGFRASLKNIFTDYVALIGEVPALSGNTQLIANIQRSADLLDYMPPRALYLMWQAMAAKVAELEGMTQEIRQTLYNLPPLTEPAPGVALDIRSSSSSAGNGGVCAWAGQDKPVLELIQARLELMGWELEKVEGLIPDIEVKGEAGGEAGVAVANATASAGAGVKPTDGLKSALKLMAYVPQRINWSIKMNVLRAKAVCSFQ